MRKVELFQAVSTTAYAVVDIKKSDSIKTMLSEKITASTDAVVSHFDKDLTGLCQFLTDSIRALKDEGVFGEGKNAANLQQNLSRRFATAVERHTAEWSTTMTLTGYNPVKAKEKVIKARKSASDILTEKAGELGADETAITEIFASIEAAKKRAEKRSASLRKMAAEKAAERQVQEHYSSIIALAKNGKSAEEIAGFFGIDQDMTAEAVEKVKAASNG